MSVEQARFEQWCILEVMGHQKFAGYVTEETVAGASFVRIDIPGWETINGRRAPFTRYFGASSIYSITPTTEMIARAVAERLNSRPIDVYDFPEEVRRNLLAISEARRMQSADDDESDEEDEVPY